MNNSGNEGSRARSRWGDRATSSTAPPNAPTYHTNAKSRPLDDDNLAMAALLNDANARSQEQQRQTNTNHHNNHKNRSHGSHNNNGKDDRSKSDHYRPNRECHDTKRIVEDDDDDPTTSSRNKRRRRWNDSSEADNTVERGGRRQSSQEYAAADAKNDTNRGKGGHDEDEEEPPIENPNKVKADFGLSGALAQDTQTGNVVNGITLKFSEPPEARIPNTRWRLYVFRRNSSNSKTEKNEKQNDKKDNDELMDVYHISRQSAYLFGRERKVADIPVDHPSLSKQHAVLQYRALPNRNQQQKQMGVPDKLQCKPYLMDLESTNGTFINGVRLDSARYYELRRGDVVTLGASSREYVLLTEQSAKTGI